MTHTADAVPFVIYDNGEGREKAREGPWRQRGRKACGGKEGIKGYNEKEAKKAKLFVKQGHKLLKILFAS
jgi:2,3-bisphosphoglycerate-independent phosphoglycerate mutase